MLWGVTLHLCSWKRVLITPNLSAEAEPTPTSQHPQAAWTLLSPLPSPSPIFFSGQMSSRNSRKMTTWQHKGHFRPINMLCLAQTECKNKIIVYDFQLLKMKRFDNSYIFGIHNKKKKMQPCQVSEALADGIIAAAFARNLTSRADKPALPRGFHVMSCDHLNSGPLD